MVSSPPIFNRLVEPVISGSLRHVIPTLFLGLSWQAKHARLQKIDDMIYRVVFQGKWYLMNHAVKIKKRNSPTVSTQPPRYPQRRGQIPPIQIKAPPPPKQSIQPCCRPGSYFWPMFARRDGTCQKPSKHPPSGRKQRRAAFVARQPSWP